MDAITRKKYTIEIKYDYEGDLITYKMQRECTSIEAMFSYMLDWIEKYGNKYGVWIEYTVYAGVMPVGIVYNDTI